MPFLLAEILNFQGSTHLIGVGSLSKLLSFPKTSKAMLRYWCGQIIRKYVPDRFCEELRLR